MTKVETLKENLASVSYESLRYEGGIKTFPSGFVVDVTEFLSEDIEKWNIMTTHREVFNKLLTFRKRSGGRLLPNHMHAIMKAIYITINKRIGNVVGN